MSLRLAWYRRLNQCSTRSPTLLTAVTYVGARGKESRRGERLRAFFACLYYAGLRPGELLSAARSPFSFLTVQTTLPFLASIALRPAELVA